VPITSLFAPKYVKSALGQFDVAGNITQSTDSRGFPTTFTYDISGLFQSFLPTPSCQLPNRA
jgi:YD repeat-containing protein